MYLMSLFSSSFLIESAWKLGVLGKGNKVRSLSDLTCLGGKPDWVARDYLQNIYNILPVKVNI